jgi:hypothetical protein
MTSYKINGVIFDQADIDYVIHLHKSGKPQTEIAQMLEQI